MTGSNRGDFTTHQLRVFTTVVRTGSLTKAALRLNIPQPSVSRLVARLEAVVGTPLLDRSSGGVRTTAAGAAFDQNAQQAVAFHDLAIAEARAASGLLRGDIILAAPDSVGGILFAPLVSGLKTDHPAIRLRTIASQSIAIGPMLARGEADIGIIADTHQRAPGRNDPLFQEDLYLVGLPDAEILTEPEVSLADLAGQPLIVNAMPGGFRPLIDEGFADVGVTPKIAVEIDSNSALIELMLGGAGFGILPYSLIAALVIAGDLRASRLISPTLTRTLSVATAPNKPSNPVLREVLARIKGTVQAKRARAKWHSPNKVRA